jgi:hypothetical protein
MSQQTPGVTQLAVFAENAPGRLAEITAIVGDAGVNIRGFAVADTADFGIVRLIVDDPDRAARALRDIGFAVHENPVLCVDVPDVPGGLANVLRAFSGAGVNIEYMYSAIGTHVCFSVTDIDRAATALGEHDVRLVRQEDLSAI